MLKILSLQREQLYTLSLPFFPVMMIYYKLQCCISLFSRKWVKYVCIFLSQGNCNHFICSRQAAAIFACRGTLHRSAEALPTTPTYSRCPRITLANVLGNVFGNFSCESLCFSFHCRFSSFSFYFSFCQSLISIRGNKYAYGKNGELLLLLVESRDSSYHSWPRGV